MELARVCIAAGEMSVHLQLFVEIGYRRPKAPFHIPKRSRRVAQKVNDGTKTSNDHKDHKDHKGDQKLARTRPRHFSRQPRSLTRNGRPV